MGRFVVAVSNTKQDMAKHKWQKGESGNPSGRPKCQARIDLEKALKIVAKKMGKGFIEDFVEKAYDDSSRATALIKKILPDLTETDLGENTRQVIMHIIDFAKVKK